MVPALRFYIVYLVLRSYDYNMCVEGFLLKFVFSFFVVLGTKFAI